MKITSRFQSDGNKQIVVVPQLWKRMIFLAAHEAKRTECGVPTCGALAQFWWLHDHRPPRTSKLEWSVSFECACEMIGRDPVKLRQQLVAKIEASWKRSREQHLNAVIYVRRAQMLACAGVPTAICRQYQMPLVDEASYEDVAGIEQGDQYAMYDRREHAA